MAEPRAPAIPMLRFMINRLWFLFGRFVMGLPVVPVRH